MTRDDPRGASLLFALQRGLPLTQRPFADLGGRLGLSESEVLAFAQSLFAEGSARRLGAVFDARRLGYRSALCAVACRSREALETAAAAIVSEDGVTHCYQRGRPDDWPADAGGAPDPGSPDLWFTLAAQEPRFPAALEAARDRLAGTLLVLPARRRFKIDVTFDLRARDRDEPVPESRPVDDATAGASVALDADEQALVRHLQGHLPPVAGLFDGPARALGLTTECLIARLRLWRQTGRLRRVALTVRHRQLGFSANCMCVWRISEDAMLRSGRRLAAFPEITHCYERLPHAAFNFNLYAMTHAGCWEDIRSRFQTFSDVIGVRDGRMFCSLREFKKTSMRFFAGKQ